MNRQSLIINLTLLLAIIGVTYLIYTAPEEQEKLPTPITMAAAPPRETNFDPESVRNTYTNFGEAKLYQAIMTPTPTPTPPPPPPEKTPDIHNALKAWRLMGAGDGEATIEDRGAKEDSDQRIFFMKVGEEREVNTEVGGKKAKLSKIDQSGDVPAVEFTMEGSAETKKVKMEF
ncbi:hypothetical protein CVU37_05525 [candidate division BRC1 bacterium HGW-BRC1-1]|nr:MAG: hypothetical protein CVU37_05525 [candidate division BRC1 bacterium HGW-BRC1-1]